MRLMVFLMVAILIAGVVFTAYRVMTYNPPHVSKYLASLQKEVDDVDINGDVDKAMEAKKERIVSKIKRAIGVYKRFEEEAPQQAKQTIQLIIGMVQEGKLPSYFIRVPHPGEVIDKTRKFDMLDFSPENYLEVNAKNEPLNCEDIVGKAPTDLSRYKLETQSDGLRKYVCVEEPCPRYEYADIMIGNALDNKIYCEPKMKEYSGDQLYILGPGDDIMDDKYGNKIVNGGTGNDDLRLGGGRKILVFEEGWGNDKIYADCINSKVDRRSVLSVEAPVFWKYKYTNFIIFGPTVNPEDMEWETKQKLVNKRTGDSITFKNDSSCFNLIYAAEKM